MKHERHFSAGPLFPALLNMADRDQYLATFVEMILGRRVAFRQRS